MSDIKRYMYARDGMVPDAEHLRGSGEPEFWVRFTDHEAAIALRTRVCAEAFEDELARTEERVLADAKARIEDTRALDGAAAYQRGVTAALAALNQPQTEKMCRVCRNVGPPGYNCSECDGGGAATAAGVADADLEGVEVHINGSSDLSPDEAKILGDAMKRAYVLMKERQGTTAIKPTPYAKAFRERVCPVPEFPGIKNRQEDQA